MHDRKIIILIYLVFLCPQVEGYYKNKWEYSYGNILKYKEAYFSGVSYE